MQTEDEASGLDAPDHIVMRQCRAVRMVARPKFFSVTFSDASDLGFNDDASIP